MQSEVRVHAPGRESELGQASGFLLPRSAILAESRADQHRSGRRPPACGVLERGGKGRECQERLPEGVRLDRGQGGDLGGRGASLGRSSLATPAPSLASTGPLTWQGTGAELTLRRQSDRQPRRPLVLRGGVRAGPRVPSGRCSRLAPAGPHGPPWHSFVVYSLPSACAFCAFGV